VDVKGVHTKRCAVHIGHIIVALGELDLVVYLQDVVLLKNVPEECASALAHYTSTMVE
jgi:hypothetical protein